MELQLHSFLTVVDCVWNVMAHAQKPDFVFRRNGRVHLNRRGLQFSRLLAVEVCASRVVMLDTPCSEVVWRVLATHSIRQFPLHFPSRASTRVITFQLDSTWWSSLARFTPLSLYPLWNSHRYTLNRKLVGPQSQSWRFREEQIFCPLRAVEPRFLSCSARSPVTISTALCDHSFRMFRSVRRITKSDYRLRHVCPSVSLSVCSHRTTRLALDGFSWNLVFENFSKICREN